jgi:FkbM family methyltransferase
MYQQQIDLKISKKFDNKNLNHKFKLQKSMLFYTPNRISNYRVNTLFTKEEDTIKWIEQFKGKNKIFFDIGANIGIYSIYSAMLHKNKTFSFEPQYNNCILLEKNIQINRLEQFITIIPNPIHSKNISNFFFSKKENVQGSAFASFMQKKNLQSYSLRKRLALSFSIDFMVNKNLLPIPNYIKIDVDGNEYEVIKGSLKTINSPRCKSILIENCGKEQKYVEKILKKLFFSISNKSHCNTIYNKN